MRFGSWKVQRWSARRMVPLDGQQTLKHPEWNMDNSAVLSRTGVHPEERHQGFNRKWAWEGSGRLVGWLSFVPSIYQCGSLDGGGKVARVRWVWWGWPKGIGCWHGGLSGGNSGPWLEKVEGEGGGRSTESACLTNMQTLVWSPEPTMKKPSMVACPQVENGGPLGFVDWVSNSH